MSVLVKGMNIPVSCYECPMAEEMDMQEDWYKCKRLKKHFYSWDVTEDTKEYHRPKECPLDDVPTPHGDLIDRKELLKKEHDISVPEIGYKHRCVGSCDVKTAPTVIEAEE